jgi:1,5-anhydro-D-fructose reductase (1,5-anhydro-D-mannitol-forming)
MTVGWGIVGAGDIARRQTAPAIRDASNAKLVAVHRQTAGAASAFAHEYGATRAYDDVSDLLADPDVDAVYISTPVYLHAAQTIAAARAGKHVLVEKPMAMSTAECRQMIAACEASGVQLMICYYQRFNERHQKTRELLNAGAIGQPITATACMTSLNRPAAGAWRHDPRQGGGGALMDMGVHCIDTLRFILGEVASVAAMVDTLALNTRVDDTATLLLQFANGVQGVVVVTFATPDFDVELAHVLEVRGAGGQIRTAPMFSKDSTGSLRVLTPAGEETYHYEQRTHVAMIEAFGRCIEEGLPTPVPGVEGLRGLEIVEAAYESARTGRRVALS